MNCASFLPRALLFGLPLAALVFSTGDCLAEPFGGVEFPLGARSFADSVVSYGLHDSTDVAAPYDDPKSALGPPDYYVGGPDTGYVCLGNTPADGTPGELIVRFDDNALVDVPGDDLYIFEIGPNVEATQVAVSPDGVTWYDLGRIAGSTRGVDLGTFSQIPKVQMRFVRLRDYPDGDTSPGPYGGPDIDSIGAIGAVAASPLDAGAGDGSTGTVVVDSGARDGAPRVDAANDGAAGAGGTGADAATSTGAAAGAGGASGASGAGGKVTSTADAGAEHGEDGSVGPCKGSEKTVTRCECTVPGRAHAGSFASIAGALAVAAVAAGRRARRRFTASRVSPGSRCG